MNPFFSTLAAYPLIPLFILANLAIGFWAHRQAKVHTFADYAIASRSLPTAVLVLTLLATFIESGTLLTPNHVLRKGLIEGSALMCFVISFLLIGTFIAPYLVYFPECITLGDLMEQLYGKGGKIITGIFSFFISLCMLAIQMRAIGMVTTSFFGVSPSAAILFFGLIITLYSCWGGIRSVSYTDVLQIILGLLALIIICQIVLLKVGGIHHAWQYLPAKKVGIYHQLKSVSFWGLYPWFLTAPIIHRMLMVQDKRQVRHMWYISAFIYAMVSCMIILIGLCVGVGVGRDIFHIPLGSGEGVLFNLVQAIFGSQPWMLSFIFIGFLGTLLSTVDSYLHAIGILIVQDLVEPILKIDRSKKTTYARILIVAVGILSIIMALQIDGASLINDLIYIICVFLSGVIIIPAIFGIVGVKPDVFSWVSFSVAYLIGLYGLQSLGWYKYDCFWISMSLAIITFFITHYIKNGGFAFLKRTESAIAEELWIPSWQSTIAFIASWLSAPFHLPAFAREKILKAPIRSLAFSCLIFFIYTLSAILGSQVKGDLLSTISFLTGVRFIGITLCVLLMIEGIWPTKLQPYLPLYWFLTIGYCLPFSATLTFLHISGGPFEAVLLVSSLLLLILLVDGYSFLLINLLGTGLASGSYYVMMGALPAGLGNEVTYALFSVLLLFSIGIGMLGFRKEDYLWDKLHMHKTAIHGLEHEIRNPLNKLGLVFQYFSLASEHNGKEMEDEEGKKFFGIPLENHKFLVKEVDRYKERMQDISNEIDRFREMVQHQILGGINQKRQRMHALVQAAIPTLKEGFTDSVSVVVDAKKDFEIMVSDGLFSSVITNLLYNAYKHGSAAEVRVTIDGDKRTVVVRDNGRGIPADRIGRVFDLFYTTSGSGIGLALAKMIVESSDGKISCHSKTGEGSFTAFTITF